MELTLRPMPVATSDIASRFAMPFGDLSCFGVLADVRGSWIPATGLSSDTTNGTVLRDRQDIAAKGHVALVAYIPGHPAWSPPIC